MTNRQRCRDLHAIKVVTSSQQVDRQQHLFDNRYVWNDQNRHNNIIPHNYPHQYFPPEFFWQYNDLFNYYQQLYHNGQVVPFVWTMGSSEDSNKKFILWIDTKDGGNDLIATKLSSEKSIEIEFCKTMQKAEDYLLENKDSLEARESYQIISRGFYKDENKNPLNLLDFLSAKRMHKAQVFVFTQDREGVEQHLEKQAPSFHISDWKEKLIICEDPDELIGKL